MRNWIDIINEASLPVEYDWFETDFGSGNPCCTVKVGNSEWFVQFYNKFYFNKQLLPNSVDCQFKETMWSRDSRVEEPDPDADPEEWHHYQERVDDQFGIMGDVGGSLALAMFRAVTQVIRDYPKHSPTCEYIGFQAPRSQPSRVKLYQRLASQLGGQVDDNPDATYVKFCIPVEVLR